MSSEPTSSDFDPMLALYSDVQDVKPSSSTAKVYDNIAVFEANLKRKQNNEKSEQIKKPSRREKSFSQRKKIAAEVQNRDVSKLKDMMERRKKIDEEKCGNAEDHNVDVKPSQKKRTPSNLFTIMEKLSIGPMSLLHRITTNHLRCNVYTRNFHGLRGVLVGYVVAFDRYMNLAMVDIDETFSLAPLGEVAEHQKKLSVGQLNEALQEIKIKGIEELPKAQKSSKSGGHKYHHAATTGVSYVKRSSRDEVRHQVVQTRDRKVVVKRFDSKNPPVGTQRTFHDGMPQLYHRHMQHIYVRGESIVLISLSS